MKVALDIDGVLADFVAPFTRILEQRSGGTVDLDAVTDPNFGNYPHLPRELVRACVLEVSDDPEFWSVLAPLPTPEQWRDLDLLCRANRLIFVTHRYERPHYSIHDVTCRWLQRHGISKPEVYFTQKVKSELVAELGVRLFVDDRSENCRDVAENTAATVLMPHRSYNRSFTHPRVSRIDDLSELSKYIEADARNQEDHPWG